MHRNIKRVYGFIKRHPVKMRLLIVIILFSVILHNINIHQIFSAFLQIKPSYFLFVMLLMVPNVLLQIFKWKYIIRKLTPEPSFKSVTVSVLGGFFLGAASPGRTGELARGILMPGYSAIRIASLTVVDKGFNQVMVIIIGLFSLIFLLPMPLALLPFMGEVFILCLIFNLHRLKPKLEKLLQRFTHSERVHNALAAFEALSTRTVIGMAGYSLLFYGVYVIQFYLMILCFVNLPLIVAVKTLPVVYLFQLALPFSFGDFGVKEMVTVKLLEPFGIGGAFVFSATLTNNIITFLLPAVIGGIIIGFFCPRTD